MRRAALGAAIVGGLAVAVMLWMLATRTPPPPIPADPDHRWARSEDACLGCHDVDAPAPRSKAHPLSQRCFQCHLPAGG